MIQFRSPKVITLLVVGGLAVCAATAYARLIMRDTKVAPNPPLLQAYDKAIEALGPEAKSFYCLAAGAMAIMDTSGPTEWHFEFYSADGSYREVIVSTKDKVIVTDHERTKW